MLTSLLFTDYNSNLKKYTIENTYDLYFLTYIDTPWEADDLRDKPEQLKKDV